MNLLPDYLSRLQREVADATGTSGFDIAIPSYTRRGITQELPEGGVDVHTKVTFQAGHLAGAPQRLIDSLNEGRGSCKWLSALGFPPNSEAYYCYGITLG